MHCAGVGMTKNAGMIKKRNRKDNGVVRVFE